MTKAQKTQQKDLQTIGAGAYAAIEEMVQALSACGEDDDDAREKTTQAIQEDPLSIEVGGFWTPGEQNPEPTEYRVLLATGGPAVRIVGNLGRYGQPDTATLQVQDWFTPWTDYNGASESVLLEYLACLYFGEG